MAAHGNQPTTQDEEDTDSKLTAEQETKKQQWQTFQQEVPETRQGEEVFKILAAFSLLHVSKRLVVAQAFDKLNDPHFEHEILKVLDPQKFQELKNAVKIAENEINKQRYRKTKQGKDGAEAGVWKFKRKLGFHDFDNKKQAFGIAEAVQNRITATEIKIKLQNASNIYGVELGTLQRGLALWLKENPGKGLEEYISVYGGKLYREKLTKEGKGPEKDIDKKVTELNKSARTQAAKKNKEQIIRAQKEIKRTLPLSKDQNIAQKEQILYVLQGSPSPQIQTTPQPPPTSPPPPPSPPPPQPQPVISAPPLSVPPAPIAMPGVSLPRFTLPSLPSGLTKGLGNMFGGLGNMFGGVGKGLGSIFGKGGALSKTFDLASKVGKQLINRGLDAIAPGLGLLAGKLNEAIKNILGIDVEGLIEKGALIFVGAVVAIVIILPMIIGIGVFSHITGDKPMLLTSTNDRNLSWYEFDKQHLTTQSNALTLDSSAPPHDDKKETSWQQFEKNNLLPLRQYLSLESLK